jgi:hypothetical protein
MCFIEAHSMLGKSIGMLVIWVAFWKEKKQRKSKILVRLSGPVRAAKTANDHPFVGQGCVTHVRQATGFFLESAPVALPGRVGWV